MPRQATIIYGVWEGCQFEGGSVGTNVYLNKQDAIKKMNEILKESWRRDRFKKVSENEYKSGYDIIQIQELNLHS
jgi:hypothetical protein